MNIRHALILTVALLPAAVPAAHRTSTIVLTPDERTVCAVNQDSGSVSLVDVTDSTVTEIEVGEEPRSVAVAPDGHRVYVASQCAQTLTVIDRAAARPVATIAIGGQPVGVVLNEDGSRAFVAQYAGAYIDGTYSPGAVAVVDLHTHRVVQRIPVKPRPWAMAYAPHTHTLYVTHFLHVNRRGIVTEIDTSRLAVRREIIFEEDNRIADGRGGIFNALASIALHPNGRRALVAGLHANANRGLTRDGRQLSHKTLMQAVVRIADLTTGEELRDARVDSSFAGQSVAVPSAVAFIGNGEHFVDVYLASNDIKVLAYNERGLVAERALRTVPAGPTGIAVTRDGRTAFVLSRWARSISRISLADPRNPEVTATVMTCPEPWDPRRLRGAMRFHDTRDTRMTANRWVSCAVCHLDGGRISDAVVWDLTVEGGRPKNSDTMSLAITALSSPPFFHRGVPDTTYALESFVETFHKGTGFRREPLPPPRSRRFRGGPVPYMGTDDPLPTIPATEEWKDIMTYVQALRPRPNPHMQDGLPRAEIREAAARGRALYLDMRVACALCHNGPYLTISGVEGKAKTYDVATDGTFDVPALVGLWDTAPYLHDGRAATLRDVLTIHNDDDWHGQTSHLTDREIDDLATFLLVAGEEEKK